MRKICNLIAMAGFGMSMAAIAMVNDHDGWAWTILLSLLLFWLYVEGDRQ
jgi:hypothetical protein